MGWALKWGEIQAKLYLYQQMEKMKQILYCSEICYRQTQFHVFIHADIH